MVKMENVTECEFGRGALVLAKVPTQRYWPALVEKCDSEEDANFGSWFVESSQMIWCAFVDTYKSKWVHASLVKKFTERSSSYSLRRSNPDMKRKLGIAIEKAIAMEKANSREKGRKVQLHAKGDCGSGGTQTGEDVGEDADGGEQGPQGGALEAEGSDHAQVSEEDGVEGGGGEQKYRAVPLLDDLVLAKSGRYPYWPAVVSKYSEEEKKWKNRWLLFGASRKSVRVWCSFVGDTTGRWVTAGRIRGFDPHFVDRDAMHCDSQMRAMLRNAMKEATRMHRAKRRLKMALPPPHKRARCEAPF